MRTRLVPAAARLIPTTLMLAAAGPEQKGMPQLDFASPLTISQVVWGAILFALLYVLLDRWALPKVAAVVDARHASVAGDLETARLAKADADGAVTELTAATRQARAEAQAAVATATQTAKAAAASQSAIMNQRLDVQLAEAEGRIGRARAAAMGALREVAGEAATAVVTRLTGHAPNAGAVDGAVGELLAASGQG